MAETVALVSLGCAKNLVDSEVMLGVLEQAGYEVVEDVAQADAIIVNTCAFIEPAVNEAVEALLDLAEMKAGRCRALICAGCLAQRYGGDLAEQLAEVDAFVGPDGVPEIARIVSETLGGGHPVMAEPPNFLMDAATPRRRTGAEWMAYLKIAEGCDHRCGYCLIPGIRGPYRSRTTDDIRTEVDTFISEGVREICLIAQDTSAWGRDLDPPVTLSALLASFTQSGYDGWLRLQYLHPSSVTEALIEAVRDVPCVVPYFDIPFQHAHADVLRAMHRPGNAERYLELIECIRTTIPGAALRTTFIVGYPGETDEAFGELLRFVRAARFDRLSAFTYWDEEGTASSELPDKVPSEEAEKRLAELMALQEEVSLSNNQRFVGCSMRVLIEGAVEDGEGVQGRSYRDAPDVDGAVVLPDCSPRVIEAGQFVDVVVEEALEHDLIARLE